MTDNLTTEERLENGISHQPKRYIAFRDKKNKLYEVHDTDTGRLWQKVTIEGKIGWIWVD